MGFKNRDGTVRVTQNEGERNGAHISISTEENVLGVEMNPEEIAHLIVCLKELVELPRIVDPSILEIPA
jgi:hypothetical protein